MRAIGAILIKDWDPIGVKDEPLAQDEYDRYIGGVYHLLASKPTELQVAEHISQLGAGIMGADDWPAEQFLPAARKLLALDVRLDGGPVA